MKSETFCVIMAGGIGSRFWPVSRNKAPKQFLDILGVGRTLLQQTFDRFEPLCPLENILVVTNREYASLVKEQLPKLKDNQILAEPFRKNTAPCIAFANTVIKKRNPNATIIVTPADHIITGESKLHESIKTGLEFASNNDALLTLGIKPHKPETGYGYIQIGKQIHKEFPSISRVKTFTEKPNEEMATIFFESGEFFWNSGIFIWSLSSIEHAFKKHLPEINILFTSIDKSPEANNQQILEKTYTECENISIDYGIMEKADNVFVEITNFGWSDLGTWSSLHEASEKDANSNVTVNGKSILYDSSNCIIHIPKDKVCVVEGLSDYIIVESGNAIMICPRGSEQRIRQFSTDVKTELGIED